MRKPRAPIILLYIIVIYVFNDAIEKEFEICNKSVSFQL